MAYRDDKVPTVALADKDVEVLLTEDGEGFGELRTAVQYRYGETKGQGYSTTFRRINEVHGSLNGGDANNGSLIVIKIIPLTDSIDRRFNEFSVRLRLERAGENDSTPTLRAFAPAAEGDEYFQEKKTIIKQTKAIEANISLKAPVAVESQASISRTAERESEHRRLLKLTSQSAGIRPGVDTWVKYTIQPAVEEEGIGDCLAVAMIVQRECRSSFYILVETSADVSNLVRSATERIARWVKGKGKENKLRLGPFGPTTPPGETAPEGVDADHLEASSGTILNSLAYLHLPERGSEKLFLAQQNSEDTSAKSTFSFVGNSLAPPGQLPTRPITSTSAARLPIIGIGDLNANTQSVTSGDIKNEPGFENPDAGAALTGPMQEQPQSSAPAPAPSGSRTSLSTLNSRAVRHRLMASHYQGLARLHLEEAVDMETQAESYMEHI